jgi:hypothetical protein
MRAPREMPNLNARTVLIGAAIIALALNVVEGLRRGKALLFYSQVDRSEDPIRFWTAVGISAALAVGAAVTLVVG